MEHQMKILIIGDASVGKSSLVHRYVRGVFNSSYRMTVGVDFAVKLLQWSEGQRVRLQLWDIAGQERFISMSRIYYRGASGCLLMFDVASAASFHSCRHWKRELDSKARLPGGGAIPCILLANKCDLPERAVSTESIESFSRANGFLSWMETSVAENRNIGDAMRRLVREVLASRCGPEAPPPPEDGATQRLDGGVLQEAGGAGCC